MKIRRDPYRKWRLGFNVNDSVMIQKISHISNVVKFAEIISDQLKLSQEDKELASFIAQHHDDGRFIQWNDYHTFRDSEICNDNVNHPHAGLAIKMLFDDHYIEKFAEDISDEEYKIIYKAISRHSDLKLDKSGMTSREISHCEIIRDADILDNIVNVMAKGNLSTLTEAMNSTLDRLWHSEISDEVFETFVSFEPIDYGVVNTTAEWWLAIMAYVYNLSSDESLLIVKKSKCIERAFDRVDDRFKINQTNNKIKLAYVAVESYIDSRV